MNAAAPPTDFSIADATTQASAWTKTAHFVERQNQRNVSDLEVGLALRFGVRFHEGGGDVVHFLGRRRLPKNLDEKTARRADGVVVVVAQNQTLVTTYRNPQFIRELKKRGHEPRRGRTTLWTEAARATLDTFQIN